MKRRRNLTCLLALAALATAAYAPAGASAASAPGTAVVLVSGFNTITPFTTPATACNGQEGPAWSPQGGVAQTLKGAGLTVFSAPAMQGSGPPATPCSPGTPVPPVSSTYINTNGELNQNGQQLGNFLAFLHTNYGINQVDLVAHSDGGLWSRAAITQQSNFPGVTVRSLTTLGTPHTGSFVADIAEDVNNGTCKAGNKYVQFLCLAFQNTVQFVVQDLGPVATEELSSDYLTTWNPEQRIGGCQVTGIAGTYFNLGLPTSILPAYYNSSDGLVGQASALGQASKSIFGTAIPAPGIPNFQTGGQFPVVHGTSFSYLTKANLLNTQAVSSAVLAALGAPSPANCTAATPPAPQPLTDGSAKVTFPLHSYRAARRGHLPRPRKGDQILSRRGVKISCRGRRLRTVRFLDSKKIFLTIPRCRTRLTVSGGRRALMIRALGQATVTVTGTKATVATSGLRVRRVELRIERGKRFVKVPLAGGRGTLPAGSGPTSLRVTATTPAGGVFSGSATVSR